MCCCTEFKAAIGTPASVVRPAASEATRIWNKIPRPLELLQRRTFIERVIFHYSSPHCTSDMAACADCAMVRAAECCTGCTEFKAAISTPASVVLPIAREETDIWNGAPRPLQPRAFTARVIFHYKSPHCICHVAKSVKAQTVWICSVVFKFAIFMHQNRWSAGQCASNPPQIRCSQSCLTGRCR